MAAATARPGTQQSTRGGQQSRGKDHVLTDDDFLFVPPSTAGNASARGASSPRSSRFRVPVVHRTIVGAGTCGVGPRKTTPRNVHKEWLQDKKVAAKEEGGGGGGNSADSLPSLTPKEARDAEKRRKKEAANAREEELEMRAQRCARDKKERRAEAASVKKESETFTTEYVQAMLEKRDRDKRRAREWNAEMSLIGTMSPERQLRHRRRTVSSDTAGGADSEEAEDLSPQKHKQKLMRQLREEMRAEQQAWKEMTESQRRVTHETVAEKHQRIQQLHASAREALQSARDQRKQAAAQQREQQQEYRQKWSGEAEGWHAGRGESVKEARTERKKRAEAVREQRENEVMDEVARLRAEAEKQQELRQQRLAACADQNKATAEAVRASLNIAAARADMQSRNHRVRDETQIESARLRGLRDADKAAEAEHRKGLHEDILRSRSTSPRKNMNSTNGSVAQHHTPRPPPPRVAA
jgi:hypothetical protein